MPTSLELFRALYRGRTDVWGSVEGKSNKEAVTDKHYDLHLKGERSLGVYPLLDDGTCFFAAIDIDEKKFEKAKGVRDQLYELNIPAYIAQSKGKGYHVYTFAETKFIAHDIRYILHSILSKLGFTAEVFPKQDKLDEIIKYGNYINLPCYGDTRHFLTSAGDPLPTDQSLPRINRVKDSDVQAAVKSLPPPPALILPPIPPTVRAMAERSGSEKGEKGKRGRKKKASSPPCVESMLKGVTQGARDVAAFALARHYLDQLYLPEEVLTLLMRWDAHNKPPIGDIRLLQTKIQSAEKGYAFGCSSIKKEPLISNFCVGEDQCQWIQQANEQKKKEGTLEETISFETDTHIYEEILDGEKAIFACYDKQTFNITNVDSFEHKNKTYIPRTGDLVIKHVQHGDIHSVKLSTGVEEYGSTKELCHKIMQHLGNYVELPSDLDKEWIAWYILMTWVYDRLPATMYLRFKGDTGTGKTRALDAIGDLCYKSVFSSGADSPAALFRTIDMVQGTTIIDEADVADSTEANLVIKFLNQGLEPERGVTRINMENLQPETFSVFGPKVIATRRDFSDRALEARCHTIVLLRTKNKKIPTNIKKLTRYEKALKSLKNQLLLYRFRTLHTINPDDIEKIDLGDFEPRLKQGRYPFALIFANDPEMLDRLKTSMQEESEDEIQRRADALEGRLLFCLFSLASTQGKNFITAGAVKTFHNQHFKDNPELKSSQAVGKKLGTMGIKAEKKRAVNGQSRFYVWDPKTMKNLREDYFPDSEEFNDLFS